MLHRDPLCQIRLPGCTGKSEVADHITPAAEGGRFEPNNLRGACHFCNSVLGGRLAHTTRGSESHGHQVPPTPGGRRPVTATRLH